MYDRTTLYAYLLHHNTGCSMDCELNSDNHNGIITRIKRVLLACL